MNKTANPAVDKKRKPGKFILTGSANVLLVPRISESLAGRIEILNRYPFSPGGITRYRKEKAKCAEMHGSVPILIPFCREM